MVQSIPISDSTTLKYLRDKFNLERTAEKAFFSEWFEGLPEISDVEKEFLDRTRNRYFYQLDEGSLLENGVKMMIVSPLLHIAGFYDPPFKTRFEPPVQITVDIGEEILQGRIDALVVHHHLWICVIEAKRTSFSLGLGIPQALAYMLCNPAGGDRPTFGFLTSGEDFIFIKLVQGENPLYALSKKFSILNEGELYEVLQIMKRLGAAIAI